MRRREFLAAAALVPIAGLPPSRFALRWPGKFRATRSPSGGSAAATRTFEITTRVELDAVGPARAWLPLPLARETAYQRDRGHTIGGNASRTRVEQVGAAGKPLPFLMYPQAEAGGARRDSLDPAGFRYTITAREL